MISMAINEPHLWPTTGCTMRVRDVTVSVQQQRREVCKNMDSGKDVRLEVPLMCCTCQSGR